MKQFIDKLIGRLEEKVAEYDVRIQRRNGDCYYDERQNQKKLDERARGIEQAIEIVNQLAEEYNNVWISADVELPTKNGWYWGYYVTSSYIGTDGVKHNECKYASIYWEDNLWLHDPRSFRTVDEVIAWKPIEPYHPKGE